MYLKLHLEYDIIKIKIEGSVQMIDYTPLFDTLYFSKKKKSAIADELGISRATMSRMTKGEPVSLSVIEKLCLGLNVDITKVVEIKPDIKITIMGEESDTKK